MRYYAFLLTLYLTVLTATAWQQMPTTVEAAIPVNTWQTHAANGDAAMYLRQLEDFNASMPPYRYRAVGTLITRAYLAVLPTDPAFASAVVNTWLAAWAALLLTYTARRFLAFTRTEGALAGIGVLVTWSLQNTLVYPLVDPAAYLAGVLVLYALLSRRPLVFALAVTVAVWTKEVYIAAVPVWMMLELWDARQTLALGLVRGVRAARRLRRDAPVVRRGGVRGELRL